MIFVTEGVIDQSSMNYKNTAFYAKKQNSTPNS